MAETPYAQASPEKLPPHQFDLDSRRCRHCFVPEMAVLDGMVIEGCAGAQQAADGPSLRASSGDIPAGLR